MIIMYRKDYIKVTEKLYYQDAYIKDFTTKAVRQEQDEMGNWYVVLAATAFYPTGGGQPYDMGTLNGIAVVNVEEIGGEIRHYVEIKLEQTDHITGVLNWERRFDHMQQHAGQHILTAAFVELFQIETVSFHLGLETATIDLNTRNLTLEMVKAVEIRANEILRENRPIETKWVTKEEALQYNLRKELSVTENIRLVIIPNYDYNGCGGTHPTSTGQVSTIKVLDWEKQKNNIRVRFVCGDRVLKQLQDKHDILLDLSRRLSSPEKEMSSTVQKLLITNKEQGRTIEELNDQLLQFEAEALITSAKDLNGQRVACRLFENRTVKQLQKLAKMITNQVEDTLVLFVTENGPQLQFICVRGTASELNMNSIVKEALPFVNGKGGGSEQSAQGGGEAIISGKILMEQLLNIVQKKSS